jgi:uncharacterized membrane protein
MKKLHRKLIDWYVKFRTSYWYVLSFMIWIGAWIFLNKSGIAPFDNSELTYLNLILSVLAELQSILLLVYTQRIADRNERADAQERANVRAILDKLNAIHGEVAEISEEIIEEEGN